MYEELTGFIKSIRTPYYRKLAESFFVEDKAFAKAFQFHSAAKSVHHGFVGGLLEHTLSVVKLCDYYAGYYPLINRDLLLTAAMFHDLGKTKELSVFRKMITRMTASFWAISSSVRRWYLSGFVQFRISR